MWHFFVRAAKTCFFMENRFYLGVKLDMIVVIRLNL